jgi:hypothetical protein
VFARSGTSSIKFAGSGNQEFQGILYNPGDTTSYDTSGCSTPSKCTITLTGTSGGTGGGHGPAMMVGQIVGDNFSYSGSAVAELFYRPCTPTSVCLSGTGSGLVE